MRTRRLSPFVATLATALAGVSISGPPARADAAPIPLAVTIDPTVTTGAPFGSDFMGLSIEAGALATAQTDGTTGNLASQLASLGTPVLRFGGDSVETTAWAPSEDPPGTLPTWAKVAIGPADLRRLATLVRASRAKVILGVGLGHKDASAAAAEAASAQSILGSALIAVEVGNEPNNYVGRNLRPSGYGPSDYQNDFDDYESAITAAAPGVPVTGPSSYSGSWLSSFSTDGQPNAVVTQHIYPQNACAGPTPTITTMLSRGAAKNESGQLSSGLSVAGTNNAALRISESNNVICSGQPGVSDRFASALWAVDYLSLGASLGVAGINLHTGSLQQCGPGTSPAYALLCAATASDLAANVETPQPEWWGLQLLRPLVGSTFVPAAYTTKQNVVVRAVRDSTGVVRVVVDDMDPNGAAASAVNLVLPSSYRVATIQRLQAASLDSTGPITLGGSDLAGGVNGSFGISVPAASAALVTITTATATPAVTTSAVPATTSALGAPVSLTATVKGLNGAPPSGLVAFTSGGAAVSGCTAVPLVAVPPATSTATCTTRALPSGRRLITATYLGDNTYVSAVGSLGTLTIGAQALRLTTQRLVLGDGTAMMTYKVSPHGSASVVVRLTASARGHATQSVASRTSSGTFGLGHLADNVKYSFAMSVRATNGQLFTSTVYGIPLHLPTIALRSSAGRVTRGGATVVSGTVVQNKTAVAGQLVTLYATVGKRSVIQGKARTDRSGRFAFVEHPHAPTTYQVVSTFGTPGKQATGRSKGVRVVV